MTDSASGPVPDFTPAFRAGAALPLQGDLNRIDFQRIWLAAERRAWQTLAVVPADGRVSSHQVASLITALGHHHGEEVGFADLGDIRLNGVAVFLEAARELVARGQRVVFATRSIGENLATVPLARAADGVILCVSLGSTSLRSIEEAVLQIGKDRFLGSVLVDEARGVARPRRAAPASREARS
jgi:hypothetical protein